MKTVRKYLLALLALVPLLGPTASHQVAATPGTPLDVGVYEEDFTTYTYKDYTENTEWDIWANALRMSRLDSPGQRDPAVAVNLLDGSLLVVWYDGRNGNDDIYAQRLDASGNKLWAADVRVNSDSETTIHTSPAVAVDGSGNAVVVWDDRRNGNYDIYAQKLDGSGNKLWAADVCINDDGGTVSHQYDPAVAVESSGNAVVVWYDGRNGNDDIYAQKLDASGNKLWVTDLRVDSDSGTANQTHPTVAADGSGNTFVVWEDLRNGSWDVYAQKLDASGNKLWTADLHVSANSETQWQMYSAVAVDGSGNAFVVWYDAFDIRAQKLDASGNKLWTADARVNSDSGGASLGSPAVAVDGSGNAVVVWPYYRYNWDIRAQKLDASGNKLWAADVRINSDSGAAEKYRPAVGTDGSGNSVVVWEDGRNSNSDIYAQKLDADGNKPWAANVRVNFDSGMANQRYPAVGMDGNANAVVVWQDERNGNLDIYAQKLVTGGNTLWTTDVGIDSDGGTAIQTAPAAAMDSSGNTAIIWDDYRNGDDDIYAQKLDASGNRLWTADVRVNSDGGYVSQDAPAVVMDGGGNAVAVWYDLRNGDSDIYAQKLDVSGNKLWSADVRVNSDSGTVYQYSPALEADGNGNAVVAWRDDRSGDRDIYAQKLDASGNTLWTADVRINSDSGTASQTTPAVTMDGTGNAFIVWEDQRNGDYDIYAQKLDASGNKVWPTDVRVNSDSGTAWQWFPAIAVDGNGNTAVVWDDNRNHDYDIYTQKLDASGNKLLAADMRVNVGSGTAYPNWPAMGVDGSGNIVVAWEDGYNVDLDIHAQKSDAAGSTVWMTDVGVVHPDLFYILTGTAQSRSVDTTDDTISEATLTAQYTMQGGNVIFYLTNNGGENWAEVTSGVTHVFATVGSDLRWRVEMASNPVWRHLAPTIEHLRIEYQTTSASGDDYEPDDTCAQSQPIQVNSAAQQHAFHQYADSDWGWFDATVGSIYIIQVASIGSRADVQIELYDQCDQPPTQFGDNSFGPDVTLTFQAPASGIYYVKVSQSDSTVYGADTGYEFSVRAPTPTGMGAAVIVAGRDREDDYRQPIINATANLAYQIFLAGGFAADDVTYLNADGGQPGVDDAPTKANIRDAIQDWARTRVGLGLPLWVYLADHGDVDRFHNDVGETVTAAELDLWLSNIEATSGVDQINVIIDACYSGSFIDTHQNGDYGLNEISGHGRVIVGSTTSRWYAYAPHIVMSQPTPLMYFSDGFWHALDQGHDIWSAFLAGRATVEAAGQSCGDYDYVCQRPWLEDNGDAWFDAKDSQVAQARGLAASDVIAPYIDWVDVSDTTEGRATIHAQVRDDGGVTRVWARVFAPSFQPPETTDGSVPVIEVPEVELENVGSDVYQLEYGGFTEAGVYQVVAYALDDEDNAAMPKWVEATGTEAQFDVYLPLIVRSN